MKESAVAENEETVELKILFDGEQMSRDKLEEQSRKVLREHLSAVELKVEVTTSGHSLLCVKGPLANVDACHTEIGKVLIGKLGCNRFFRLVDEAGDKIRRQAYPILAELEQDLRAFVNQSIVEVLGFEWWTSLGKVAIPGLDDASVNLRGLGEIHHPLELTQFDDLVKIMTTDVAEWEDDRALSTADLLELLTEAKDIEDLKSRLARRRARFSFWDQVFARYFANREDWRALKRELDFVIEMRHRVMHHRPVHLGQLTQLKKKRERLSSLLMSARDSLPEQERVEIRRDIGHLREIYATIVREATGEGDVFRQFLASFYEIPDLNGIIDWLEDVGKLEQSDRLSVREAYDLRAQAFRKLQDLTQDSPDTAEPLILDSLLPYCVVSYPNTRVALNQLHECLTDWLNQYPARTSQSLRAKILDNLYPYLETSAPQAACWAASHIGYRTDRLVDALSKIAKQNDDSIGDTALSTLTTLGVSPEQREWILAELHRRAIERGPSLSLISALSRLADPSSIDIVYENWLGGSRLGAKADVPFLALEPIAGSVVLNIFRSVMDSQSEDVVLQDRIWQMLHELAEERPQEYANDFYLGLTAPSCDSTLVVPQMLEWLAREEGEKKDPEWGRHLICLRLEECVRPKQLEGWDALSNQTAFELLQRDACQDTGSDLAVTTKEDMVKRKAWETLFRAGYVEALDWFDAAVVPETSGFMQQTIIDWFAAFRMDPLPETVLRWVQEHRNEEEGRIDARKYAPRIAAVQMSRSAATREAFDALLNFGLTIQGKAPMQTVEALADVASGLIREGDAAVIDELVDAVIDREEEHQRVAAAYALQQISRSYSSLLLEHVERLIPALYDTSRDLLERGTLISILGYLQDWQIPDKLLHDLEMWAREAERWVGGSSLETLVRHGHLYENHNLLNEILGLQQVDGRWDLDPDVERFEWAPYIVGMLYYDHPDEFAPAIAHLLRASAFFYVPQILGWLLSSHSGSERPPVPQVVKRALIERIYSGQSESSSETGGFQVLARLAPQDLVQEDWKAVWVEWLPDSRSALADALGETDLDRDFRNQAISSLQSLASDGHYAVRQAAYRGLVRQSTDALYRLCVSWSAADEEAAASRELRQRAAEACGWLDRGDGANGTDAFEELYQKLVTDRERVVREAARRARDERRKRLWARQYLLTVMDVKAHSNKEVLSAWRYGDALARIGDETCIRTLRDHLAARSRPPNVRYWLEQIIRKMQENWRKTTQKWPEPWFAWEGRVDEGQGKLWIRRGQAIEIGYSVWLQPAAAPSKLTGWGGAMWPVPIVHELSSWTIELEDGHQGRIVATSRSGNMVTFKGSGPYPL